MLAFCYTLSFKRNQVQRSLFRLKKQLGTIRKTFSVPNKFHISNQLSYMTTPTPDLVRSYLQEIGRYLLLAPDQEITLARLVQEMMAVEQQRQAIALQLNRQPTDLELATSLGQNVAELQSVVQQGQKAKQKMVTANLRLVVSVAKKYQNHNLDFLDLIQEGTLGLQKGVEKFDPNKGYKLSTYAKGVDSSGNHTRNRRKISYYWIANPSNRNT
jgi:hypothetical protein